MSILQRVYDVGTTPLEVIAPTADYVKYVIKNIQPKDVIEYARDGYIFLVGEKFTITAGASVSFSFATGPNGAQLDFYQIVTDTGSIYANLIEGATIVTTGAQFPVFNLNRNVSSTAVSVLKATTSVTGGSIISSEFVTASNQGGGTMQSTKIHTLAPNSNYAMKFTNQGNQTTDVFFQLGFSEHYNGLNNIWLETVHDSYVLRPGEELMMDLTPNASIVASSLVNSNKLSVMRQK